MQPFGGLLHLTGTKGSGIHRTNVHNGNLRPPSTKRYGSSSFGRQHASFTARHGRSTFSDITIPTSIDIKGVQTWL